MTPKQCLKIKGFIVDVDNHLNRIFPFFNSLNCEFSSSFRLIDNFSSHFSFYQAKKSKTAYLCKLDNIFTNILLDPKFIIVVSDTSINIVDCLSNNVGIRMDMQDVHGNIVSVNVTITEAELFAIRCEINQAIQIPEAIYIIVITNIIYLV